MPKKLKLNENRRKFINSADIGGIFINFAQIGGNAICIIDLRGMDVPAQKKERNGPKVNSIQRLHSKLPSILTAELPVHNDSQPISHVCRHRARVSSASIPHSVLSNAVRSNGY